ncbi:MAG: hypothetical protein HQL64_00350 [Magnetococcales bacterium]|nr:hypothetical protein [Magnetococcales bacterium]
MTLRRRHLIWIFLAIALPLLLWNIVKPTHLFVDEDKFSWSIDTVVPKGVTSLSARHCGSCHEEIFREWSESMHARSWTDEYFQAEWNFEKRPFACLGCHVPLKNQKEHVDISRRDKEKTEPVLAANPDFDPQLRDEGVTCAVCHVRKGIIIGPHASEQAPHPVKVDPGFLSGTSPCRNCHVVSTNRWDTLYRVPACGTVEEVRQGDKESDCVGCHLPNVTRPMVNNAPLRQGGRHLFQGGHHPPQVARALKVDHRREEVDGKSQFVFTLTNVGADHRLPTGKPDRLLTLEFRLLDEHEVVMHEKIHKIQRTILRRPIILELWDNRLSTRVPREFIYELPKNGISPRGTALDVTVRYHLLDETRRKHINYENTAPVSYSIFHERFDLSGGS